MSARPDRWSRLRRLPLRQVAVGLGYRPDPRDRNRFRRDGSVISINGAKFYDHIRGCGGGGAIDLVIHAEGTGFNGAVGRLRQIAGEPAAEPEPQARRALALPPPADAAWPAVRRWLTADRALAPNLVSALHRRGLLHADARRNAVFLATDRNRNPTGAECHGTAGPPGRRRFRGMATGSRKDRGSFWIPADHSPVQTILIAESAIDALSAFSLAELRSPGTVFLSTSGATGRLPAWIGQWTPQRIICAFDADAAGDEAAERLAAQDPRVTRLRPEGGKDWNEILAARRRE